MSVQHHGIARLRQRERNGRPMRRPAPVISAARGVLCL